MPFRSMRYAPSRHFCKAAKACCVALPAVTFGAETSASGSAYAATANIATSTIASFMVCSLLSLSFGVFLTRCKF